MPGRRSAKGHFQSVAMGRANETEASSMQRKVHDKLEKLAFMGLRERDDARADGVSSFYIETIAGDVIVEEKPSGATLLTPFFSVSGSRTDSVE